MFKILLNEKNSFCRVGLESILNEMILKYYGQQVKYSYNISATNINTSKIVLLSLCKGEIHLCQPFFQGLSHGILVVLVDGEFELDKKPQCCRNTFFINRRASKESIELSIEYALRKYMTEGRVKTPCEGQSCGYNLLNRRQRLFFRYLSEEQTPKKIAQRLRVKEPVIYMRRVALMARFGFRKECELVALMNRFNYWMKMYAKRNMINCWYDGTSHADK